MTKQPDFKRRVRARGTASWRPTETAIRSYGSITGERTDPVTDGDFALMRYTANGSVDPTFGTGGLVTTDFGGGYDEAFEMTIQRDGRIVLSGGRDLVDDISGDFALARYTADGLLDSTFGSGGKVSTGFTAGEDIAYAVTSQPDGRIVAAGAADFALNVHGDFAVARYTTSGVLDPTFSGDGQVTTDFAYGFDNAFDVAIQSDGKIMTTGEVTNPRTSRDIGLVRYLAS